MYQLKNFKGSSWSILVQMATLGQYLPKAVNLAYDWIGFDPRGVGSSRPSLSCQPNYLASPRPNYIPSSKRLENFWLRRSKGYAMACINSNSELLKHMTTMDTVRDMESIRIALGREKINYGFSYGTYLGQVYATLYPSRVRRMVLDSNVDPRTVWFKAALQQSLGFDRNAQIWFRWLAKYDSVYHLGKTQEQVAKRWQNTLKQVQRRPVNGTVGAADWVDTFVLVGYSRSVWPSLATAFAQWVHKRNADLLLAWYMIARKPGNDNSYASFLAVICTDALWPQSWKYVRTENRRTFSKAPITTWANAWLHGPCQYWPQNGSLSAEVDGSKAGPILLVGETLDAATTFEGNLEIRRRFPRARLISLPNGTTHAGSLSGNACVGSVIARYLRSGRLPPRNTGDDEADIVCSPLPEPVPLETQRSAVLEIKDLLYIQRFWT
jgi:pimeloyl-ACP methyl ester carboxylesterase